MMSMRFALIPEDQVGETRVDELRLELQSATRARS